MAFEPSVVIFDACILYPFHLRNIVVQIAVDRLVDARWTDEIHDEWIRNLVANRPAIPIERLQITRRLMNDALPGAMVAGYQRHIPAVTLPDPDDRHVVAAGIASGATIVLTWNLRDFPPREMKKHG
jgi:PIN domain